MNWRVPRMWEGGECWIIGGGPSMTEQFNIPNEVVQVVLEGKELPSIYSPYLSQIHGKHVIGVNAAYLIGDWIDMVFFGDGKWFLENRERLAKFPGLKVSCHPKASKYNNEHIKYLPRDKEHGKGISSHSGKVSWNGNSGAAAISVAANAGVKRIILVGFDMKLDENFKQHWHGLYGTANRKVTDGRKLPFHRHLVGFSAIAQDARKRGIEILNACPDSTIKEFPKLSVEEILNGKIKRVVDGFKVPDPVEGGKRFDWLTDVINERGYKIGAEVGVARGRTTGVILRNCRDLHLYAVDLWEPVPNEVGGGTQCKGWKHGNIRKEFNKNVSRFRSRLTILQGLSWEMAKQVKDGTLDFVFIDADHEYESVMKDIRAWSPKLKSGGMMSGHDTHFEGVLKAVNELIPNHTKVGIDHVWECKKEDVRC
ncbi:MAG TPA: class I SAM-dependent methyltransferase [bacterium]|nr:class I SAM-dependent methyltransferase [bacterium]